MMHKLMTHRVSPSPISTRVHRSGAKVGAKHHTDVKFFYGLLFGLIAATSLSGVIAAWLVAWSFQ